MSLVPLPLPPFQRLRCRPFTLEQQVQLLLHSSDPLRRWLVHACGATVGHTSSPRDCPVALFLRTRLSETLDPAVYADTVVLYAAPAPGSSLGPKALVSTPRWVRNFVVLIDRGPAADERILLEPVRRDWALEALRRAIKEQG